MPEERVQFNVRMDRSTLTRLQFISTIDDKPISELVRGAIDDLLKRYSEDGEFSQRRDEWLKAVHGPWDGS